MQEPLPEPQFRKARTVLRTLGPLLALAGLVCIVVAMVDAFGSSGFHGPRLFWLFFVGGPLLLFGTAMSMFGYMGVVARYQGREVGPAVSATFNDIAKDSAPGVRAIAGAVRDGVTDEVGSRCPACAFANDADARFCAGCGGVLEAKACGSCGHPAKADARFCDECGAGLDT